MHLRYDSSFDFTIPLFEEQKYIFTNWIVKMFKKNILCKEYAKKFTKGIKKIHAFKKMVFHILLKITLDSLLTFFLWSNIV